MVGGLTILAYTLLGLVAALILIVLLGSLLPVNRRYRPHPGGVELYIGSNGLHTEFILPAAHPAYDWTQMFAASRSADTAPPTYYGIGWGNRSIYLDLSNWSELTLAQGLRSLFIPSPAIMHVKRYGDVLPQTTLVQKFSLSEANYLCLCHYIRASFGVDAVAGVCHIAAAGYTPHDDFYDAEGRYHGLHTCNSWINTGLKRVGVRTTLWTPFDRGLFYQLGKAAV